jgi:hypothetical protein
MVCPGGEGGCVRIPSTAGRCRKNGFQLQMANLQCPQCQDTSKCLVSLCQPRTGSQTLLLTTQNHKSHFTGDPNINQENRRQLTAWYYVGFKDTSSAFSQFRFYPNKLKLLNTQSCTVDDFGGPWRIKMLSRPNCGSQPWISESLQSACKNYTVELCVTANSFP